MAHLAASVLLKYVPRASTHQWGQMGGMVGMVYHCGITPSQCIQHHPINLIWAPIVPPLVSPWCPLCLRLGRLLDPPLPMITKRTGTVLGMAWAGHPKKAVKLPGKMANNGWISKILTWLERDKQKKQRCLERGWANSFDVWVAPCARISSIFEGMKQFQVGKEWKRSISVSHESDLTTGFTSKANISGENSTAVI